MGRIHLGLLRDEPGPSGGADCERVCARRRAFVCLLTSCLPSRAPERLNTPRSTLIGCFIEQCRSFDIETSPDRFEPTNALRCRYRPQGQALRRRLPPHAPQSLHVVDCIEQAKLIKGSTEHPARKALVADFKLLGPLPWPNRAERRAVQTLLRKKWRRLRGSAGKRGIDFDIEVEDVEALYWRWRAGRGLFLSADGSVWPMPMASIGRIDNARGYEVGNFRLIMWVRNRGRERGSLGLLPQQDEPRLCCGQQPAPRRPARPAPSRESVGAARR